MADRIKISRIPEVVPKTGSYKVEYGEQVEYFHYDDEPSRRLRPNAMTSEQALAAAQDFARKKRDEKPPLEIEVHTARYEREHGHKPAGRRFWCFTLVSPTATAKDHFLNLDDQQRTFDKALEKALEVAKRRGAERIIVEP